MKNDYLKLLLLTCLLPGLFRQAQSQTTKDLFSRPGLSLGAYHDNFFDGTWSTSYRYAGDTILCGDTLVMVEQLTTKNKLGLKIEGGKIRTASIVSPCLLGSYYYDFDLHVGETFDAGPIGGHVLTVVETGQKPVLNGDSRRYLRLSGNPNQPWSIEWIEGIGDVKNGLFPAFYDFEGYDTFVCARDSTGDLWSAPASSGLLCDSLLCPEPVAGFSRSIVDKEARFFNHSTDAYTWHWDFGDGQFSTEKDPEHVYDTPGCYEVCLTARTPCLQREFKYCQPVPICVDPGWTIQDTPSFPASEVVTQMTFPQPDTGWIKSGSKIWKTTDGGSTWNQQILPPPPANTTLVINSLYMADTRLGILGCGSYGSSSQETNIFVTKDGQNWLPFLQGDGPWVNDAVIAPDGKAFAVSSYHGLLVSVDFGQTWAEKAYPTGLGGFLHPTKLLPMGGNTLYLLGAFESFQGPPLTPFLMRTYNNGDTWDFNILPGTRIFYSGFFFDAQNGWLPGGSGFLLHTTDSGNSWQEVPYFESTNVAALDFFDTQHGWAVGEKGLVLHTQNGGQTWSRENCGYISGMTSVAARGATEAYTTSYLRQLLRYAPSSEPLCGSINTVDHPDADLRQGLDIYPNPASSEIAILVKGGSVETGSKVLIFNQLGQIVLESVTDGATVTIDVSTLRPGVYGLQLLCKGAACASGRFVLGR